MVVAAVVTAMVGPACSSEAFRDDALFGVDTNASDAKADATSFADSSSRPLDSGPLDATGSRDTKLGKDASDAHALVDVGDASTSDSTALDAGAANDASEGGASDASDATAVVDATPPMTTFTTVYTIIIQTNCTGCHTATHASNLNMSTQALAYSNLVNVTAAGSACGNSGLKRVVPGIATASLIYQKVTGTQTCGASMPYGSTLPTVSANKIREWINEGALNN